MSAPHEKLDFMNPAFIFAFIAALFSDLLYILFGLGLAIPVIGIAFAALLAFAHYLAAFILLFLVLPKLHHFIPKLVFLLALLIPLPFLTIGIIAGILLQNRIIEQLAIEGAAIAAGAVSGGVGAGAVKVGQYATRAAEVAQKAQQAGRIGERVGGAALRATERVREGAQNIERLAQSPEKLRDAVREGGRRIQARDRARDRKAANDSEAGEENEPYVSPEALGEELPIDEQIERNLFELGDSPEPLGSPANDNENVTMEEDGTIDLRKSA